MTRFSFAAAHNAVALAAALALSLPCASSVLAQSDPNHVVIPSDALATSPSGTSFELTGSSSFSSVACPESSAAIISPG